MLHGWVTIPHLLFCLLSKYELTLHSINLLTSISLYYHFAILLLFRRFIDLRIIGSQVSPRQVCLQSADSIQSLANSYAKFYTLRRTPSFMPYFAFASATLYLAVGAASTKVDSGKSAMDTATIADLRVYTSLKQSISTLREMAQYQPCAKRALCILYSHSYKWNLDVYIDEGRHVLDGYKSTAKQCTSNLDFGAQSLEMETRLGRPSVGKRFTRSDEPVKAACIMESVWSAMFCFQDRATTLPSGPELGQTGFAVFL